MFHDVSDPIFVGVLLAYFGLVLAIGYYGFVRTQDEADFLVAGRDVGPIVGGATLSVSQMSAGTLVGTFGIHYLLGFGFIWVWVGLWTGWLVSLLLVAPQLRQFGRLTVPDFIATRYGDDGANGGYARATAALLIVIAYTVYLSAQVTAGGLIFQALLGIPEWLGMSVMVAISIVYTMFGGMRASILTDFLQTIVMIVGVVMALPIAFQVTGGIAGVNAVLLSVEPSLVGQALPAAEIVGFMLAFGFSIAAAPNLLTRVYAMRDQKTVRYAIGISLVFQLFIAVSIALLGLTMRVMFPELSNPDLASVVLSVDVLGPVLGALLIAAVLSAALSTIDSVMIVSGAGIAHDIYAEVLNPEATERQRVMANRIAVFAVGAVPLVLALNRELVGGLVQLIVVLQASLMGGMFFVPLVLGLHWKRANTPGGIAGMISGFVATACWHVAAEIYPIVPSALAAIVTDPVIPGVLASFLAVVTVSIHTSEPSRSTLSPFFELQTDEQ